MTSRGPMILLILAIFLCVGSLAFGQTDTETMTETTTETGSPTESQTPTFSPTVTLTVTFSQTLTPSQTLTSSKTLTASKTPTRTITVTPFPTPPIGESYSFPNPFDTRDYKKVRIAFPPDTNIKVTVYTILGELVATLKEENINEQESWADWDGLDDKGGEVASGMYLYIVKGKTRAMRGRMTILR